MPQEWSDFSEVFNNWHNSAAQTEVRWVDQPPNTRVRALDLGRVLVEAVVGQYYYCTTVEPLLNTLIK